MDMLHKSPMFVTERKDILLYEYLFPFSYLVGLILVVPVPVAARSKS